MRTVILCGGKGTRAYPHTIDVPKPLLEVDGQPVLRQVMEVYAAQGFADFVLAAGYKIELIEAFVEHLPEAWRVDVVDTGEDTNTAGRVLRCRDLVGDTFFVTYADGVGNVNLAALLAFHRIHGGVATLTTVPLPSQYGTIVFDGGGRVAEFREKPQLVDHNINAGFFVFDSEAFDHWAGEDLENEVLPALGAAGLLFAFRHNGFWRSMDTYKDALELSRLCAGGSAPWRAAPPLG
jgi:glucose-1-phosphate cytidylyltransferase